MMAIAKLFRNGAAGLSACHASSGSMEIACVFAVPRRGVLTEPTFTDVDAWFAELDRFAAEPFLSQ